MPNTSKIVECQPLKHLSEVLSWKAQVDWSTLVKPLVSRSEYCYDAPNFTCHTHARRPIKILRSTAPKTMVCHDMKGGYLDDRFVDGTTYHYQYIFYHWSVIDTFIYFSHYFITIPPLMWINAAHTHGVDILGTIITEHEDGKAIWREVLASDDNIDLFTTKLVEICDHYKFDGYLVNIENDVEKEKLPNLQQFLIKLKEKIRSKKIIWYDAVSLIDGKLKWQNELNEHNKPAFDICDGVFLNYTWKLETLERSLTHAGNRSLDVYVGIDVFGRNCFGGGGYQTYKALEVTRTYPFSAVLFAPGWTYETQAQDNNFFAVERKFWTKLWPFLYVFLPNTLPFETTFNIGISSQILKVKSQSRSLRYNLSYQKYHLSLPSCIISSLELECIGHCLDEGVSKGCSAIFNHERDETEVHRILLCDFICSGASPLKLTIATKWPNEYSPFKVVLWVENEVRSFTIKLTVSNENEAYIDDGEDYTTTRLDRDINEQKLIELGDNDWVYNKFSLLFSGRITEIHVELVESVLIGLLSLQ